MLSLRILELDEQGRTPLDLALAVGAVDCIQLLNATEEKVAGSLAKGQPLVVGASHVCLTVSPLCLSGSLSLSFCRDVCGCV